MHSPLCQARCPLGRKLRTMELQGLAATGAGGDMVSCLVCPIHGALSPSDLQKRCKGKPSSPIIRCSLHL